VETSTLGATSFNQTTAEWWRPPPPLDPAFASPWPEDAEIVDRFQDDGAALLCGAFVDWVEPLRAGLERNLRAPQNYAFPFPSPTSDSCPGNACARTGSRSCGAGTEDPSAPIPKVST